MPLRTLALAALIALPTAASAEPMWETANIWTCETASHFKITVDGANLRVNEESNRKVLDFAAGTASTNFSGAPGTITGTRYYEGGFWGNFNLIEVEWYSQPVPMLIVERYGEYWVTVASGHSDRGRELWIANYRCRPER